MTDPYDARIRELENRLTALQERTDISLTYITRDIAGVTRTVDELRLLAQRLDERAEKRDKELRALLEERQNEATEGTRWKWQQLGSTIGLFLAAIALVLNTFVH